MAGQQPQDPRWQPPGEPAADQLRPSWQPFGPAEDADADTHAFSVSATPQGYQSAQAQAAQAQAAQAQARALERGQPQDQRYAMPGEEAFPPPPTPTLPPGGAFQPPQGYTPPGQAYEGYEAYGVPGQPGLARTDPPPGYGNAQAQWQASSPLSGMRHAGPGKPGRPGRSAKSSSRPDSKGFLASLFDFSFSALVTPRLIKALYVLATIWTALWAIILIRYGFHFGGFAGGLFTLIIVVPIFILLMLGGFRVVLEVFVVLNRIHDDLRAIRGDGKGDGRDVFRP